MSRTMRMPSELNASSSIVEELIDAHQKDLKIIQKVCILLMLLTFALGLYVGIIIK